MDAITDTGPLPGLAPFSLKDAPALIERVFPAQKVGIESQKERKAVQGQTLTALGSYWKGRKPLVLVRACILACLLPATSDAEKDLEIFEALMRMDVDGLSRRLPEVTAEHVWESPAVRMDDKIEHIEPSVDNAPDESPEVNDLNVAAVRKCKAKWRTLNPLQPDHKVGRDERSRVDAIRDSLRATAFSAMPFSQQVSISERTEKVESLQCQDDPVYVGIWPKINAHLGTDALTLPQLIEQLGVARYGRRPIVGDPFCGGGSIPFEAARVGCDVEATDLNPIAAMLTWASKNVIGASEARRSEIKEQHAAIVEAIDAKIRGLGIELNAGYDRAKAYLYCMEVVDPQTGWRVPLSPSWIISRSKRCAAKMVPDYEKKRFNLVVEEGLSAADLKFAELGTVSDGALVYRLSTVPGGDDREWRVPISRLRGDGDGPNLPDGRRGNKLRPWTRLDVAPCDPVWDETSGAWIGGDIWLERLYAIQWISGEDLRAQKTRPRTWFAGPTADDLSRETRVLKIVASGIADWQKQGLVPDTLIEPGEKTDEPIRTRGWTHWHHLFSPRHLLFAATVVETIQESEGDASLIVAFADTLNRMSRLTRWDTGMPGKAGGARDGAKDVFYNQALNTNYSFGQRASFALLPFLLDKAQSAPLPRTNFAVNTCPSSDCAAPADLWIFDPPYADAVHYHEITEFFIAWLRKDPPPPFDRWIWDSRRPLAIQGKGEKFRSNMVDAFRAMAVQMPDNGLQICMFTHQDAGVWADMAQIVWGAGLRVTAAWYVSTETTSDLKKGGYVQGTVLLVLRKRQGDERAYKDELVLEVRGAVQRQVDLLTGLNQRAKARQRDENPFSDADVQMAGYAAALEVLTGYTHIESVDMTREALRPRIKGQVGIVEEMIALAVQTATELMRPEGIDESLWERLVPTERFWLKMTEAESNRPAGQPAGKLDDYQNFAKAYRADSWDDLMADSTPNKARLKGAADFKRAMMTGHPFAGGLVRPVLYAVNELRMSAEKEEDHATSSERAISGLRDNLKSWAQQRQQAMIIADWLGRALTRHRPTEASAARTLAALIRTERLG